MMYEEKLKNISRLFVGLPSFERRWKEYGLHDEDRRSLELVLLNNPRAGDLIQGTHGVRKIRHAIGGHGKSGGIRVFYYDFESLYRIYFLAVILKNDQENLTKDQRNRLGDMILNMKRSLQ